MISVYEEAYMCNRIQIAQKECHLFNKRLQESKQYLQKPARKCYKLGAQHPPHAKPFACPHANEFTSLTLAR